MPLSAARLAGPLPGAALLAPRAPDTCRRARTGRRTSLQHLADLARRAPGRPRTTDPRAAVWQLLLPLWPTPAPDPPAPPGAARPWAAKFSLFTLGTRVVRHTPCRLTTPPLCWIFPDWDAPTWSEQAGQVYAGARRQFSISP